MTDQAIQAPSDQAYEETADRELFMVVTLKSGVQIRVHVAEFAVGKNGLGDLGRLRWTAADADDDADVTLQYIDLGEVAAVHAERIKP